MDYLFNDILLDQDAIELWAFDGDEVEAVARLKEPLRVIRSEIRAYSDADAIAHPMWAEVRKRASEAVKALEAHSELASKPTSASHPLRAFDQPDAE